MNASTPTTLQALRRGDLAGARELRLPGVAEFPREIFGLADTLEILDLGGGALSALPDDMNRLRKLRVLFCSGASFERLPASLGDCPSLSQVGFRATGMREIPGEALPRRLRWLTLTDNCIERLPEEIGHRPHLQKLMLAGNRLKSLPASLAQADSLELARLSSNGFESLPPWLANLPRLAWISWGGNPAERDLPPSATAHVSWSDLEIGDLLGEGASGRVHHAFWRANGASRTTRVALKLFKGAMTSDGAPEREMAACLAAGEHPNLTSALGRLVDHPDGMDALLMPLLPTHWRALAQPPSLATCSRDVYSPELRIAPAVAMGVARRVAAAAAHLHDRGLLHGDLYAHNILWDGRSGEAALGDFGAACALPAGKEGDAWRRVEVRAWGLLLGELLDRCAAEPAELAGLRELEYACVQPDPRARPLMADVACALQQLRPARRL